MEEIWKDIKDYEGLYQVSNLGNVKSLPRQGTKGGLLKLTERQDKKHKKNYLRAALTKNGKTKWYTVSRLVAEAFIPNPDNLPEVDHINNNEVDNRVENLQWISKKDNIVKDQGIKIICVETGEQFDCIADAHRAFNRTIHSSAIREALDNKNRTAYGYHWRRVQGGSCSELEESVQKEPIQSELEQ